MSDRLPEDPRIDRALRRHAQRPVAMGDALREALDQDMRPVTFQTPWQRAAWPVGAAAITVASSAALLPRSAPLGAVVIAQSAGIAALIGAGMYVVFARGEHGLGTDPKVRWAYAAVSLVAFEAVAVGGARVATDDHGTSKQPGSNRHVEGTAADAFPQTQSLEAGPLGGPGQCASYGTIVAALVGALIVRGARRTTPVSPESSGVVAGVTAGLAGALALHTHGPADAVHMALSHGAPLLVGAVVGAVVGRKTLTP